MPLDPYAYDPNAIPAWDGPWPPDPSWDDPTLAAPPILPPPAESPVPDDALTAPLLPQPVDPYAPPPGPPGTVRLSQPTNPDLAGAPQLDAIDPNLITMGDEPQLPPDAGPVDPYADMGAQPWDADLIEQDAAPAEPFAPTDAEREARLGELLPTLSDEQLALRQFEQDRAAEDEAIAARSKAAAEDRKAAEDNERVYRTAVEKTRTQQDQIAAESDRLANERVDPDGWRDSRGLFQTLAMYTAGIVGGLLQSRNGGPNQGLAMINNEIERHIDAQKANLAHRRDMLGRRQSTLDTQQARIGEDFTTEEAFRQAAWKRVMADIETEKQNYNPAGSRALKYESFQRDIARQAAASQQAAVEHMQDRNIKIGEYDLKVNAANEAIRARRAAAANAAAARRAAAAKDERDFNYKVKHDADVLAAQSAPKAEDARFAFEVQKNLDARTPPGVPTVVRNDRGVITGTTTVPLKQEDGTPYVFPDTETAAKLRTKLAGTAKLVSASDALEQLRGEAGSELFKSGDARKMLVEYSNVLINLKDKFGLGVLSGDDLKLVANAIGTDDPTEFRSYMEGIHQMRARGIEDLNLDMRNEGNYTGPKITFDNRNVRPGGGESAEVKKAIASEARQSSNAGAWLANAASNDPNLPAPDARQAVDSLVAGLISAEPGSTAQDQARADLAQIGKNPRLRAYAQSAAAELGVDLAEFGVK